MNLIPNVVDISYAQEFVDWKALIQEGIKGVIIRIGTDFELDTMFITHINNAIQYGIPYGIYYYSYADTIEKALQEAKWVEKAINQYITGGINPPLGIWYDVEDKKIFKSEMNAGYMVGNFINYLNSKGFHYVGVYSSYSYFSSGKIDLNLLANYVPIWVSQYEYPVCSLKEEYPNRNIVMWQFSSEGSIGTYPIDLNIHYQL